MLPAQQSAHQSAQSLQEAVGPVSLVGEQVLPVLPALEGLLPCGALRRGSTVAVLGSTSLALALAAAASAAGSWCAAVGLPSLGLVAVAELGVSLDRLALVGAPGESWPSVVAALLDALDVVVVRPPGPARGAPVRRLAARARERGAVLVPVCPWEGADVCLAVTRSEWHGLGAGYGHLRSRRLEVTARGRRAAARPRQVSMWLPERP